MGMRANSPGGGGGGGGGDVTGWELLSRYNWAQFCTNCLSALEVNCFEESLSPLAQTVRGSRWIYGIFSVSPGQVCLDRRMQFLQEIVIVCM